MNGIDLDAGERAVFWRHPSFRDMGLLKARFRRHRYDLHTHPTYVIALITGGCERVRVSRRRELAAANTVLVVNPEECHDGEAGCAEGWTYRTFYPSVALMEAVARELGQAGVPVFARAAIDDPGLAAALAWAHRAAEGGAADAEAAMLVALRRLIVGHADGRREAAARTAAGCARRVAVYRGMVEAEPAARFELARFAAAVGVTRFQVIRDFRQVTGLTPGAFVRDRRVRVAGRLIAEGAGLAEAALAAGFADQAHLSRVFKRVSGVTPGVVRAAG